MIPGREYDKIQIGDLVTVRYEIDQGRVTRTAKFRITHMTLQGWNGEAVITGWHKVITKTNCEILKIHRPKRRLK